MRKLHKNMRVPSYDELLRLNGSTRETGKLTFTWGTVDLRYGIKYASHCWPSFHILWQTPVGGTSRHLSQWAVHDRQHIYTGTANVHFTLAQNLKGPKISQNTKRIVQITWMMIDPHFGIKYASHPDPVLRFCGTPVAGTKRTTACYEVSYNHNSRPL